MPKFLIPILVSFLTQFVKIFINLFYYQKNFKLKQLIEYGGMPSGHSAGIISLCYLIYKLYGINSGYFIISVTIGFFILRDALGLRNIIGLHADFLNKINKKLNTKHKKLKTNIGHNILQIIVGGILGIIFTELLLKI